MKNCMQLQAGQSTVEYSVVLIGIVITLLAAPAVMDDLLEALKKIYQAFTYAISISWFPVV